MFFQRGPRILPEVHRVCKVGAMTEGNIHGLDRKKQLLPYLLPHMLNTYQRGIKLFELSQDTNIKELKVIKN